MHFFHDKNEFFYGAKRWLLAYLFRRSFRKRFAHVATGPKLLATCTVAETRLGSTSLPLFRRHTARAHATQNVPQYEVLFLVPFFGGEFHSTRVVVFTLKQAV